VRLLAHRAPTNAELKVQPAHRRDAYCLARVVAGQLVI
jgi:hypothetical protein